MRSVIWFNNWFSSLPFNIESIRNQFKEAFIIGSNTSEYCTYKSHVDLFIQERKGMNPDDYLDFAVNICKSNNINIFFVRNYVNTISKNKKLFEDIGTTLVCEDYEVIKTFYSKGNVYKYLEDLHYDKVPEYYIVNNLEEYRKAYNKIKSDKHTVCSKFDHDEGAQSFRIITNEVLSYRSLNETLENIITNDNMESILLDMQRHNKFKQLMVMPKLKSPEVSVDCYNSKNKGFIAIPRYKIGGRVKIVKLNKDIIDDCKKLVDIFGLKSCCNIQYRWDDEDNLKLLEINPRISGGIHISGLTGFSIINQIIADILNIDLDQTKNDIKECTITQYENPIIID